MELKFSLWKANVQKQTCHLYKSTGIRLFSILKATCVFVLIFLVVNSFMKAVMPGLDKQTWIPALPTLQAALKFNLPKAIICTRLSFLVSFFCWHVACRSLTSEHEKLPSQHGNLLVQDSSFFKPRMPKGVSFRNTCTFYGGVCVCVVGGD